MLLLKPPYQMIIAGFSDISGENRRFIQFHIFLGQLAPTPKDNDCSTYSEAPRPQAMLSLPVLFIPRAHEKRTCTSADF